MKYEKKQCHLKNLTIKGDSMRIAVIGVYNVFVNDSTQELSEFSHIDAYILKGKNDDLSALDALENVQIHAFNKRSPRDLMKFILSARQGQTETDIRIFHYLNPFFSTLLAAGTFRKPMVHFCYGGDIKQRGLKKWLLRRALHNMSQIFSEQDAERRYLQSEYQLPNDKIESSLIIWNVNSCFKAIPYNEIKLLRQKWGLFGRYIFFSPRTLDEHYNHHLLLEAINLLDEGKKKDIEVVITGVGDKKYIEKLLLFAQRNQIRIKNLDKFLTPQEMAEIFNISHVNVNIPKHDQFGRSIIEGSFCGSIPLLNIDIPTYHDEVKDKVNCIYTRAERKEIAEKIVYILENCEGIKAITFKNNVSLFQKRQDIRGNTALLVERLEELATK